MLSVEGILSGHRTTVNKPRIPDRSGQLIAAGRSLLITASLEIPKEMFPQVCELLPK